MYGQTFGNLESMLSVVHLYQKWSLYSIGCLQSNSQTFFYLTKSWELKKSHILIFVSYIIFYTVVTGLPTTTAAPPPSQKWVRDKQVGGGACIPCEWQLTLKDESFIQETVSLIQRNLNNIDEEGLMEVEVCWHFAVNHSWSCWYLGIIIVHFYFPHTKYLQ